jgi:hypothetical protein
VLALAAVFFESELAFEGVEFGCSTDEAFVDTTSSANETENYGELVGCCLKGGEITYRRHHTRDAS